jgi:uncharacterized damage-inducible protein DinB
MRGSRFILPVALAFVASPVHAQAGAGLMADLLRDVEEVESKVIALAEAIPADKFGWRPGEGVRSTGEVFQHLAADNWLLAGMAGSKPPAFTGIDPTSYPTVQKYESRSAPHAEIIDHLKQSFEFVKRAMADTPESKLGDSLTMFGQESTVRGLWVLTTTHMHEHLGQLIAYARTTGVVPPWSRGGE